MKTKIEQEKAKLKVDARNTAHAFAIRENAARDGFFEMLTKRGYTPKQSTKIWNLYISRKLLTVNHVSGGWTVKAGNLLDDEVLHVICETADVSTLKFGRARC